MSSNGCRPVVQRVRVGLGADDFDHLAALALDGGANGGLPAGAASAASVALA